MYIHVNTFNFLQMTEDKLIQITQRRLTLHTIATLYLYLTGLQGLPVSYKKMRIPTQYSHPSLP
jgi:hypothetical protein